MAESDLRPGATVRIRNQRWRVLQLTFHGRASVLEVAGTESDNRGTRTRFLLPAERVERLVVPQHPRFVRPDRWRRLARGVLADAVPRFDSLRAAAAARMSLIPFQLEPALAVTRGAGSRVLIADEVGLGKTVQAGLVAAELLRRQADARVLIVTPASLREQWSAELAMRFALRAVVFDGRLAANTNTRAANPWSLHPLVITSIDYVKRPEVLRSLEALVWDLVVFDEAHALCGASDRASAADGIGRRARCVVLLSATPHSGDEAAFARLCRIGALAHERLLVFRRTRADAGLAGDRRTRWLRVRPSVAEAAMHRSLLQYAGHVWRGSAAGGASRLAMIVLLKRASSSAAALERSLGRRLAMVADAGGPVGTQMGLPFAPDEGDAEPVTVLGAPGLDDLDEECAQLRALLGLARTAANHETKVDALRRLLRRARQPAIVFTEYRDTLASLVTALRVRSVQLHGGLTASERREAVRTFTQGDVPVLFATDAASEGLNLQQRCRLVVNVELPWTPLRLEQRIGRVDRIGQGARVHAVHLVASGTPEEGTVSRLVARASHARASLASVAREHTDQDVAAAILTGAGVPPHDVTAAGTRRTGPEGVVFPDLRQAAEEEARRIAVARALAGPSPIQPSDRPVVTLIRQRHGSGRRICWCVRVPLVDRRDRVWWSIIAAAELRCPREAGSSGSLRSSCDPAWLAPLGGWIAARGSPAIEGAVTSVAPWVAVWLARERAIADDLHRRRGRLAALQPSLFDRRAERHGAARSAELDVALQRCTERVDTLSALGEAAPGAPEPLFTVVFD